MSLAIATDDGGFGLEAELVNRLAAGNDVDDLGAHALADRGNYPDYVLPLARAVIAGQVEHGIAIRASGVGAHGMRE